MPPVGLAAPVASGSFGALARRLGQSWALALVIVGYMVSLIITIAWANPVPGAGGTLVDFDAFYIVGLMALDGRLFEAYHAPQLFRAYVEYSGVESFMPWTYPPMFDLVAAGLALMPRGMAYGLFTGAGFALWLWVLWRLSGPWMAGVLLAMLPVMAVMVACGQNGFLMAGLAGLAAQGIGGARGAMGAGLALGAMAMKPHLALGLGVAALFRARWGMVAVAAVTVLALAGAATAVFGLGVWPAFRGGVAEASVFLREGLYPLFRMTSLHAALAGLGVPGHLALMAQAALGFGVLALVAVAAASGMAAHRLAALAVLAPIFVSPYAYDYDLTLAGVALALVIGDLMARARGLELAGLLALAWVAGGWGLYHAVTEDGGILMDRRAPELVLPVAFWPLALAAIWVAVILRRPQAGVPQRS